MRHSEIVRNFVLDFKFNQQLNWNKNEKDYLERV